MKVKLTKAQQAKVSRIVLNVFRGLVFMKELRPSVVEVGNEDLLEKMQSMQAQFVANQEVMEQAKTARNNELEEKRKELEELEILLTSEKDELDEKIARSKRVATRYEELHA